MTMQESETLGLPLASAVEFIAKTGAAKLAHGFGRSLQDHLVGTMQILSHWTQPRDVIAAGLLHSVYGTDVYRPALVSLAQRREVARSQARARSAWRICSACFRATRSSQRCPS